MDALRWTACNEPVLTGGDFDGKLVTPLLCFSAPVWLCLGDKRESLVGRPCVNPLLLGVYVVTNWRCELATLFVGSYEVMDAMVVVVMDAMVVVGGKLAAFVFEYSFDWVTLEEAAGIGNSDGVLVADTDELLGPAIGSTPLHS